MAYCRGEGLSREKEPPRTNHLRGVELEDDAADGFFPQKEGGGRSPKREMRLKKRKHKRERDRRDAVMGLSFSKPDRDR